VDGLDGGDEPVRAVHAHEGVGPDDVAGDADAEDEREVVALGAVGEAVGAPAHRAGEVLRRHGDADAPVADLVVRADVEGEGAGALLPEVLVEVLHADADGEAVGEVAGVGEAGHEVAAGERVAGAGIAVAGADDGLGDVAVVEGGYGEGERADAPDAGAHGGAGVGLRGEPAGVGGGGLVALDAGDAAGIPERRADVADEGDGGFAEGGLAGADADLEELESRAAALVEVVVLLQRRRAVVLGGGRTREGDGPEEDEEAEHGEGPRQAAESVVGKHGGLRYRMIITLPVSWRSNSSELTW